MNFLINNKNRQTLAIVIITIITLAILGGIGYLIWYNYYDVRYVPGKVESFSWQMNIKEYHLTTHNKSDWADEVEFGSYNKNCHKAWRTIEETQPDGSINEYDILDDYCYYMVDTWDFYKNHPNTGIDKNPFYLSVPDNTSKIEYREQPGIFTVYFKTDITETIHFNYDRQTWESFREGMRVMVGVSRKGTTPYKPELPR